MQRGHLVLFDEGGNKWILDYEATGEVLQHVLPVGELNVVELPFGALNGVKAWHMDGANFVIDELQEVQATYEELLTEIDAYKKALLESEGVI